MWHFIWNKKRLCTSSELSHFTRNDYPCKLPLKMGQSRSWHENSSKFLESLGLSPNCVASFNIRGARWYKLQDLITPECTAYKCSGENTVLMSQCGFLQFLYSNYTNYLEQLIEPQTQKEVIPPNETPHTRSYKLNHLIKHTLSHT